MTARESVRSGWREYESATLEIEQARRQARTDVPPEPYGRAALDLAGDELRRTERKTKAKENPQTVVSEASRGITEAEAEVSHHRRARRHRTDWFRGRGLDLPSVDVSGSPAHAGVDWTKILADAEARHDLDMVRALRGELSGWAMAKAGASKEAQEQVAEQRTVAERAIDTVLATIGRGDERAAAEIRLAVATEAELTRAVLEPIGKAAATGSMSPTDRLSLGYAEAAVG